MVIKIDMVYNLYDCDSDTEEKNNVFFYHDKSKLRLKLRHGSKDEILEFIENVQVHTDFLIGEHYSRDFIISRVDGYILSRKDMLEMFSYKDFWDSNVRKSKKLL